MLPSTNSVTTEPAVPQETGSGSTASPIAESLPSAQRMTGCQECKARTVIQPNRLQIAGRTG